MGRIVISLVALVAMMGCGGCDTEERKWQSVREAGKEYCDALCEWAGTCDLVETTVEECKTGCLSGTICANPPNAEGGCENEPLGTDEEVETCLEEVRKGRDSGYCDPHSPLQTPKCSGVFTTAW